MRMEDMPVAAEESDTRGRVVYTILFGGYEDLLAQPLLRQSSIDAICFTDNPALVSEEWSVVYINPRFPEDIIRSQREVKVRVTEYLGRYQESLYIDNTVRLKVLPEVLIDDWLSSGDIVLAEHSYCETVAEEFDAVSRLNYDDAIRVHEQLWDYARVTPDLLGRKPLWTGMIARRHTRQVAEAMAVWFEHILRYSRRDQLSVRYALDSASCEVGVLEHDNFESRWHVWAVSKSRKIGQGKKASMPGGPTIVEMIRAKRALEDLEKANTQLKTQIQSLEAEVLNSEQRRVQEMDDLMGRFQAMETSKLWRVTAPIRTISGWLHG